MPGSIACSAARRCHARSSSPRNGASGIAERVLQAEYGRRVVLEADGVSVRKTFVAGPPEQRVTLAQDELARLTTFHAALAAVPGAAAPAPLGAVEGAEPGFRMAYVADQPLIDALERQVAPDELERLGAVIAEALCAYVDAAGEPYHDLKLDNVLYAGPGGTVTFLDLGYPQDAPEGDRGATCHERSAANLVASVIFESARPQRVRDRRLHRQSSAVAQAFLGTLRARGVPLRPERLACLVRQDYVRNTLGRGSVVVRAWYATAGYAAGVRVDLGGVTVGPAPAWKARG